MKRCFRWKKPVLVFSTAFLLAAAGIAGGHSVTAWAIPASGTAAGDDVRVRETAVTGELIGSLSDGQEVTILDETTGSDGMTWYQVTYEVNGTSRIGWVRSDLLNTSGEDTADADVTEDTAAEEAEGSFIVAESVPESVIPDGFEVVSVLYQEEEVQALYSDVLDLYLLYAVNAEDDSDAGLFLADLQSETMYPFVQFELADGSVILLEVPDEEQQLVSDRFVRTEYTTAHGGITAYQIAEPDELVAEDAAIVDYYYVYGVSEIGETGWYLYNAGEGTIQKNVTNMQYSISAAETDGTEVTDEAESSSFFGNGTFAMTRLVVCVLAVICLLLLVIAILFSVRYRRLRRILEDAAGENAGAAGDPEPGENRISHREERREEKPSDVSEKENHAPEPAQPPEEAQDRGRSGGELETRGDMDVIDLDDMGEEDYEAMLNQYLSENFPSEEEEAAPVPDIEDPDDFGTDIEDPDNFDTDVGDPESIDTDVGAADDSESDTSDMADEEFELPGFSRSVKEPDEEDEDDFVIGRMEDFSSSLKKDSGDVKTGRSRPRNKGE